MGSAQESKRQIPEYPRPHSASLRMRDEYMEIAVICNCGMLRTQLSNLCIPCGVCDGTEASREFSGEAAWG